MYPFKVIWLVHGDDQAYPVKVLISVSKRTMKKAVQRNRIKRLMRESYRLQKQELYEHLESDRKKLLLGIIYTGREMISFDDARRKINRVLSRLLKEID